MRRPRLTVLIIITLALGIGLSTSIFSAVEAVMLRNLPVEDPQNLIFVSDPDSQRITSRESGTRQLFTFHEYLWLKQHNTTFASMAAAQSVLGNRPVAIGESATSEEDHARISLVSESYFDVLGVRPALGRTFTANQESTSGPVGHDAPAVLSYDFWKRRFASSPNAIGMVIGRGSVRMTVTGVAEPRFKGETAGMSPDIWLPLYAETVEITTGRNALLPPVDVRNKFIWLHVIGRLKEGIRRETAEADLELALQQLIQKESASLAQEERASYLNQHISLVNGARGASVLRRMYREPLLILATLVTLLLLLSCANVANLMLVGAASRRKEVAVRTALGAGRHQLFRQFLIESLILAALGGALGLLISQWANVGLLQLISSDAPGDSLTLGSNTPVTVFAVVLSVITAVLCGVIPAWRSASIDPGPLLKGSGFEDPQTSRLGIRFRPQNLLVVSQVALSFALLAISMLLTTSIQKLSKAETGFGPTQLLQLSATPGPDNYPEAREAFHKALLERFRNVPGVESTTLSLTGIFKGGMNFEMAISLEGSPVERSLEQSKAEVDYVGPGFFETSGIPLIAGRAIAQQDEGGVPLVCVINRRMASQYFGNANPIGRHINASAPYATFNLTVVGIAADAKRDDLRDASPGRFYLPYFNSARDPIFNWAFHEIRLAPGVEAGAVVPAIREAIRNTAPTLDLPEIQAMTEILRESIRSERVMTSFSVFFGLVSLALASIGLYGIVSYSVMNRTKEIGLRMALGAERHQILKLIVNQGVGLVLAGIAIGLPLAFVGRWVCSSFLFENSPIDPTIYVLPAFVLSAVMTAACWLPARRASKVDPMTALKDS